MRNNSVNTAVREGGEGGAPGRAEVLLQPVEETTVPLDSLISAEFIPLLSQ